MRSWLLAWLLAVLQLPAWADSCGEPALAIHQIQGAAEQSPYVGQRVTVEGVITYSATDAGELQGAFLQSADHQRDNDPATSEALFVHSRTPLSAPGRRLRLTGQVREYHGLTELTRVQQRLDCGPAALPTATTIAWPPADGAEALEGMRVQLESPLVVIDQYDLAHYGTLTLAPERQPVPTQILPPGPQAQALFRHQQRQRLLLDDGRLQRHPQPLPYPAGGFSEQQTLRAGTTVEQLAGVLDYRFDHWRLHPEHPPIFRPTAHRPAPPAPPEGHQLRVVAFNLGNYFPYLAATGQPRGNSRGATSAQQWQRQQQRLVSTIQALAPDVLALTELASDGYGPASAPAMLARALGVQWRFVRSPDDGHDAIRVGLLYRSDRVDVVDAPMAVDLAGSRPALVQTFLPINGRRSSGLPPIRLVVTHFKSKGCGRARGANQDQDDGQGCYAARRNRQAEQLAEALTEATPGTGTLILGDLNSYARETPLGRLANAGYRDLLNPPDQSGWRYSYRFRGRLGTLDYGLADQTLLPHVQAARTWAINADEPSLLGYQHPRFGDLVATSKPWRSSDHDPVVIDLGTPFAAFD
ncbi:MAG: ExeM/NucH family extracellular endonuclease [Pseudomonadales bacterium]|nr:ExeM/NucH family extracellular endonuclease [Pseudomonadales bacterium]